ncbi:MAG: FG-GAP repeat protein, partial [Planctomycetes bacterium]|nr:FG-GAP repeat protein [Planctomycetota bacterium]
MHYNEGFGTSTALCGNTLVVGAPGDKNGEGAAHVFRLEDGMWVHKEWLPAPDGALAGDWYGSFVDVTDD